MVPKGGSSLALFDSCFNPRSLKHARQCLENLGRSKKEATLLKKQLKVWQYPARLRPPQEVSPSPPIFPGDSIGLAIHGCVFMFCWILATHKKKEGRFIKLILMIL